LQHELSEELGAAELETLVEGGPRSIERRVDLSEEIRRKLHFLVAKTLDLQRIEERGIVVTANVLREAVRRDIEALFNIERLEAQYLLTDRERASTETPAEMLADFPEVRRSVVNFGVPSFSGRSGSDFDKDTLARDLKEVLAVFEPRLKRDSIKVGIHIGDKTGLRIEINGILMLTPVQERLRLSTSIDLDNGRAVTTVEDG
jgi:type VI secretion system protein ImpF